MCVVSELDGHFSAEDLRQATPEVSRATIYRTLVHLPHIGVICRVPVEGEGLRYRFGTVRHHHHLVCVRCGEVHDIAGCGVDDFIGTIANRFDYEMVDHRMEIYVRCSECRSVDMTAS
jgi:Fur family ferric uptake transcriptional regulator